MRAVRTQIIVACTGLAVLGLSGVRRGPGRRPARRRARSPTVAGRRCDPLDRLGSRRPAGATRRQLCGHRGQPVRRAHSGRRRCPHRFDPAHPSDTLTASLRDAPGASGQYRPRTGSSHQRQCGSAGAAARYRSDAARDRAGGRRSDAVVARGRARSWGSSAATASGRVRRSRSGAAAAAAVAAGHRFGSCRWRAVNWLDRSEAAAFYQTAGDRKSGGQRACAQPAGSLGSQGRDSAGAGRAARLRAPVGRR